MYEALLREGIGSDEDAEALDAALDDDFDMAPSTEKAALMEEWGGEAQVI